MASEFKGKLKAAELDALWTHFSRLQFGWASTELQVGAGGPRGWGRARLGHSTAWQAQHVLPRMPAQMLSRLG